MQSGTIFELKEFAIYDGPGIRQTVFLKGCPLRCCWCHNPEGMQRDPELMVNYNACKNCGKCRSICSKQTCDACGACIPHCPQGARRICGQKITSQQLAERIQNNNAYYAAAGGGVTFSGGEPLQQHLFLLEVLEQLRGVDTAMETSGYAAPEIFCQVVSKIDFVFMDLKMMDSQQHKKYTGAGNERILKNAESLLTSGKQAVIRIPLIPGINDTLCNMQATADFIYRVNPETRVELLPYHRTAGAKYKMLNREFKPLFDPRQEVQKPVEVFGEYGIQVSIL